MRNIGDALLSYLAAACAFLLSHPMEIGGAILLIARLIVDIPPAIAVLRASLRRK